MPGSKPVAEEVDDFYIGLLSRGDPRPVEIGAPENDPIAQVIQVIADRILGFVGPKGDDPEIASLLQSDRVLIRTIPPAGVQAVTVWVPPRHVVAVNRGLALFLYRLARAFAAHYIVRGPEDPPAPPESEAVGTIATLLDWMGSLVHAPMVQDWPAGPRETVTADNFTTAAERFVLAHEIGHIMRRHVIANSGEVKPSEMSLLDLDRRPVEQEVEADVGATLLSIESMINEGMDPRAAVAGMHFFFRALGLAETVGAVVVDETHPPAEERLSLCFWAMDQRYGPDAEPFRLWTKQVEELLARLGSAALEERDRRRAAAAAHMEEVLQTTPWSIGDRDLVRDKALLDEVLTLMSEAPSAVLDAIAASLLDTETHRRVMEAAPSPDELERDDRWRRHQVAHFIARNSPLEAQRALGLNLPIFTS